MHESQYNSSEYQLVKLKKLSLAYYVSNKVKICILTYT